MKRVLAALLILGVAAPAAWGLYSRNEPSPRGPAAAAAPRVIMFEGLPLMRELHELNDWGIALKRRITAYIYRDRHKAVANWARECLRIGGGGFYASSGHLQGGAVTEVAGQLVNLSGANHASARFKVTAYGHGGELLATDVLRVAEFREHTVRGFYTVLPLPRSAVAEVRVTFAPGHDSP
ncbi:MAG: hypothetical protein O7G32_09450 [SAR324 cluster bacterium]|nr:hypothetical protein [SAR324 cluster bacterium]